MKTHQILIDYRKHKTTNQMMKNCLLKHQRKAGGPMQKYWQLLLRIKSSKYYKTTGVVSAFWNRSYCLGLTYLGEKLVNMGTYLIDVAYKRTLEFAAENQVDFKAMVDTCVALNSQDNREKKS